ncbi:putative ribonuclease T(2) [Rosa chinensis]|uniref:Putative ribonuclease T(2) n=1 Tax=Rosa chinensis TaxID=74649 RepID=A0A2P6RG90_ROSCH|nr:putative ribonuclease T(2) [Rosa chinensis]
MDRSLVSKLNISWPNVKYPNNIQFWDKQWRKHGSCSVHTFNQTEYFTQADNLWNSHNITDILITGGIKPNGSEYAYDTVERPIQIATGKEPELRCAPSSLGRQLLHEVVLCYNHKGTTPIDCNPLHSTCDRNFQIKFI